MLQVLACGAVVFPGLFFAFRRILPCVFKHWSDADVVLVSERLVSSIHAAMATTAGVIVVSSCRGNVINDRHWLATYFVIWYGVPYMTYDIFAMYLSHYYRFRVKGHEDYKQHSLRTVNSFVRREFLLVLHHIALLTILLPVTLFFRKDQGDFFIGCLFLTELSTPFVSMGKILIQVRRHVHLLSLITPLSLIAPFYGNFGDPLVLHLLPHSGLVNQVTFILVSTLTIDYG
uniref:Protein FAM57B-like n=1 Tax=Acanthochromis polyacanthus TaxID=80966 RepID=A0A3Q1H2D3_9TELE